MWGGRINVANIWALPSNKRIEVEFNKLRQLINRSGTLLSTLCSDVAAKPNLSPLGYNDRRLVPKRLRTEVVRIVRRKFLLPKGKEMNGLILSMIGKALNNYKYKIRKGLKSREEALGLNPLDVPRNDWIQFVEHTFSKEFKEKKHQREPGELEFLEETYQMHAKS